jgi:uncharacterized protein GlcG (DUF336 family)
MTRLGTAIAGAMILGGVAGAEAQSLPTAIAKYLPLDLAIEAAQAAMAACKTQGYDVSVAIVDRAGNLKLAMVADGADVRPDVSQRKAYTAAARRVTTLELAEAIAKPGAFNPTLYDPMMVATGGGVPIRAGGEFVGGIGVGGAPGGDRDEACARAGLAKIGDRLK